MIEPTAQSRPTIAALLRSRLAHTERGQGGFIIIAGLTAWMLVGGAVMVALLGMTLTSARVSALGAERSQQVRALDSALEVGVVEIQVDRSGKVAVPTGTDGECQVGLGRDGSGLRYDDDRGTTVDVSMRCYGEPRGDVAHRVDLIATIAGEGAPQRMFGVAELEVVALPGGGNDVIVRGWDLATAEYVPGDPVTTTTSTTTTSTTAPTTTTTTPQRDEIELVTAVTTDWGTGHCVEAKVTNRAGSQREWTVQIEPKGTIYEFWSAVYSMSGSTATVKGVDWNRVLQPGASTTFGWCTNFPAATTTTTTTSTTTTSTTTSTSTTTTTIPKSAVTWTSRVESSWANGHCMRVTVTNGGSKAETWKVTVPVVGQIEGPWNFTYVRNGNSMTTSGVGWNNVLNPGASTEFGWCARW